jgi:DNA-binding Xre family transcriptional regulator
MREVMSDRAGAAIRKLRLSRGWTLADLSAQSGIPISTLSRLELGQNGLTTGKMIRLCRALDIDVEELLAREETPPTAVSGRRSVVRAGEGRTVRVGADVGRLAAADLLCRRLTPILLDVTAERLAEDAVLSTHDGEVYLLVIDGEIELHSELYAPLPLGPGDGVYFDAACGYALTAPRGPGRALLVASDEPAFEFQRD